MGTNPRQSLLDREAEQTVLRGALDSAAEGSGRLLLIEGVAGIGKTGLLHVALDLARDRGVLAGSASASEVEQPWAFGVVRQLFTPLLAELSDDRREEVRAGAARLADTALEPDLGGSQVAGADLPAVLHGLYWLAANLFEARPGLLAIDDAHWADDVSLAAVAYLGRRVEDLPVAIVLTVRTGEPGAQRPELEQLRELASAVVAPRPLSRQASGLLIGRELKSKPEKQFLSHAHDATGGNPLYLTELLRALAEEGVDPTDANAGRVAGARPKRLLRAVLLRLASLGLDATKVAQAVSVLGDRCELRHVAQLAGLDQEAVVGAADQLAAAGILAGEQPLRFSHSILRTAVYEDSSSARRATDHARAAQMLIEEGAPAEAIAPHLLLGAPAGEQEHARVLVSAARHAAARGAASTAAAYLQRALSDTVGREERRSVLLELGTVENGIGAEPAQSHLRDALIASESTRERAEVLLRLSDALVWSDRGSESFDLVAHVIDELGPGDRELALMLEEKLAMSGIMVGPEVAMRVLTRLEPLARLGGDTPAERRLLAAVAAAGYIVGGRVREGAALVERAVDRGLVRESSIADLSVLGGVSVLIAADRLEAAEQALDEVLAGAQAEGSVLKFAIASCLRSDVRWSRGDLVEAEAESRAALATVDETGAAAILPWSLGQLAHSLGEQGRFAELEELVAPHPELLEPDPPPPQYVGLAVGLGRALLAEGRYEEALSSLERGAKGAVAGLARYLWQGPTVRTLHRLGRGEEAVALARQWADETAKSGLPRFVGMSLRELGAVTGGEEGIELLRDAVATLEQTPATLERAEALVELGAALRRANRRAEAQPLLREGLDRAQRCGATPTASRAREELRATGARPRRAAVTGVASLTGSEARVARMAASGLSNPQIAQELFVTRKTVEKHMGQVLSKLNLTSRAELARALSNSPEHQQRADRIRTNP